MNKTKLTTFSKLIVICILQIMSTQALKAQSSTPSVTIDGRSGDNGSGASGYTDFTVNILQDAQIIFSWQHTSGESYWDP